MFEHSVLVEMDPAATLAAVVDERAAADRAEANILLLAAHFADLHPVPADGDAAGWGEANLYGEGLDPLAGEGTPAVAEFAPDELAATLRVSTEAAKALIGDTLELRHRLPKLWALVLKGRLQAWKARQVAAETPTLSRTAAAFVDTHVATVASRNRLPQVKALVHEALLLFDPEVAEAREQLALDRRGVWLDHRESTATTQVTITADTPDALAFDQTVGRIANELGALGDPGTLDVRRGRAVGVIADPQATLDLLDPAQGRADDSARAARPHPDGGAAMLYLHLDGATVGTDSGVGQVDRLGAATLALLRTWLDGCATVTVRPVLDLARTDAVDGPTPPAWMRELVILRDGHCVFPGCGRPARSCDLDHIDPYDDTGPPGQTRPDNLACLCRRHHRAKTHTPWRYGRDPDGSYHWIAPSGRHHTVRSDPAAPPRVPA